MAKLDEWLEEIGLSRYAELFAEHQIDLDVLADLTEADLAQLGVALGDRKRLRRAIAALARPAPPPSPSPSPPTLRAATPSAGKLTVLFCDMVGSTALSARMDPEDLHEVIRRYQGACAEVIGRFDGYIGHYVGDGILVYFGYPRAHEDDPRRAVQAGLEIVEAVQALNAGGARPGAEMAVRIGISTGLVVAGDIGAGEFRDEMAVVGETPNLAARLQELAEPDSVVVTESTRRLVEGLFVFDELGPRTVKGIDRPIRVYRVREPSGAPSRFEATAIRGLTPLVGRDEELNLLLSRWTDALAGEGQVVLLTGEPGIGKSRLIQAFRDQVRSDAVTVLRYFCSPFYVHSALHPILDQLERAANLKKSDPPEVKLDKLEALLSQGTDRVARAAALLAPLLSIPTGERYPDLDMAPERKKALALEALLEQLAGLAAQPVLIILEDAHWIDPTSAELFQLIIERIQRMPVMAVIAYRTGFTPPWAGFLHVTSLSLAHLSHRQAAALVEKVTRGRKLPPEVIEHIVTRTDGVPLYAEELTKTLLGSGALELVGDTFRLKQPLPSISIPESLHDFPHGAPGSPVGCQGRRAPRRNAGPGVPSRPAGGGVDTSMRRRSAHALEQLVDAELIYRRGAPPDAIYEFKHALVQDAAYNSLLRSKRLQFHKRIGETLEARFPETIASKPELLAHHFREAGLPAKAFSYAMRAGEAAAARYAPTEARGRFQEALDLAHSLPPSENAARAQIEAILKLASVAQNRGHYEIDLKNLEQARSLAEGLNDRASLCQIQYWIRRSTTSSGASIRRSIAPARRCSSPRVWAATTPSPPIRSICSAGPIACAASRRRPSPTPPATCNRCAGWAIASRKPPCRACWHLPTACTASSKGPSRPPVSASTSAARSSTCQPRRPACSFTAWSAAGTATSISRCRRSMKLSRSATRLAMCFASTWRTGGADRAICWRGDGRLPRLTCNAASSSATRSAPRSTAAPFRLFAPSCIC